MTKDKKTLEAYADEKALAIHEENEAIARKNRVLRAELAEANARTAAAEAAQDAAEQALSLHERDYSGRPEWARPAKSAPGAATIAACLSDIHAGEVVRSKEVGGYNRYDLKVCGERLQRFFQQSVEAARAWSCYRYDGAFLALIGDLVSGDIHDELQQTNEVSTYDTVVWLVPQLAEGIELWRKAFGKVHVASVPGNHGRDGKVPRYKGRSAHNADTLVARLVAREFAKVEGATFEIPESFDAAVSFYGFDISLEHGEELARSFAGTAEIGSLGPIVRGTNRKRNALAAQGKDMDYALWGHFHQFIPAASRGFIANGSIKGYDEYAQGLKLRPEPPQQALFAIEPERGITTCRPVFV